MAPPVMKERCVKFSIDQIAVEQLSYADRENRVKMCVMCCLKGISPPQVDSGIDAVVINAVHFVLLT